MISKSRWRAPAGWPVAVPPAPSLLTGTRLAGLVGVAIWLAAAPAAAELSYHPAVYQAAPAGWVAAPPQGGTAEPGDFPRSASLAYRVVDDQLRLSGDSSAQYSSRVIEVLSQQGLSEAADWRVEFDPKYQRIRIHWLDVYRAGEWTDRLASVRSSVLQLESDLGRRIYDERLTLLLVLEDVRVGDRIRFAYTIEGFNPVLGDRYAGSFRIGWSAPVDALRFRLLAPPGQPAYYRLHKSPASQAEDLGDPVETRTADGSRELVWERFSVPALEGEGSAPHTWVQFPFVQVSQFASWEEVADWGRGLYRDEPLPPELRDVAAAIAVDHPDDPEARLVAASRWVQDELRYFAVTLGPHSHKPHRLAEVLRRRYGDCKDKSSTLVALLRALEIEAWPAFVGSVPGDLVNWHPSPFAFDHVVVAARLREAVVWVDATLELQGGHADELYFPTFDAALEVRPGVAELTADPSEQTGRGMTVARYDYTAQARGESFPLEIATTYTGAAANDVRLTLASTTLSDLQERYVEFYTSGERTVEPTEPLEVSDDRDANELIVTERYTVRGCWEDTDDGAECLLLPLLLENQLSEPGSTERSAPFDLPRDYAVREVVSVRAPPGWDLEELHDVVDTPWFRYGVTSTASANGIELAYELRTRAPWVEPADLDEYTTAVRRIYDTTTYSFYEEDSAIDTVLGGGSSLAGLGWLLGCFGLLLWSLLMLALGAGGYALLTSGRR